MAELIQNPEDIVVIPFTIIVDTREQHPFQFQNIRGDASDGNAMLAIPTRRLGLNAGDYSIAGFEDQISIERKSYEDLWSTLIHDRERFERELQRLAAYKFSAVVVEAGWGRVCQPPPGSKAKTKSLTRGIMSFMLRYPTTQWCMFPEARLAEVFTFQLLRKFWDHRQEEKRSIERAAKQQTKLKQQSQTMTQQGSSNAGIHSN